MVERRGSGQDAPRYFPFAKGDLSPSEVAYAMEYFKSDKAGRVRLAELKKQLDPARTEYIEKIINDWVRAGEYHRTNANETQGLPVPKKFLNPLEVEYAYAYVTDDTAVVNKLRAELGASAAVLNDWLDVLKRGGAIGPPDLGAVVPVGVQILPPDALDQPIGEGNERARPKEKLIPRNWLLVDLLKRLNIPYRVVVSTLNQQDLGTRRQEPYFAYLIPDRHCLIFVCDGFANATYVLKNIADDDYEKYITLTKNQLHELNNVLVVEIEWRRDAASWQSDLEFILRARAQPETQLVIHRQLAGNLGISSDKLDYIRRSIEKNEAAFYGEHILKIGPKLHAFRYDGQAVARIQLELKRLAEIQGTWLTNEAISAQIADALIASGALPPEADIADLKEKVAIEVRHLVMGKLEPLRAPGYTGEITTIIDTKTYTEPGVAGRLIAKVIERRRPHLGVIAAPDKFKGGTINDIVVKLDSELKLGFDKAAMANAREKVKRMFVNKLEPELKPWDNTNKTGDYGTFKASWGDGEPNFFVSSVIAEKIVGIYRKRVQDGEYIANPGDATTNRVVEDYIKARKAGEQYTRDAIK